MVDPPPVTAIVNAGTGLLLVRTSSTNFHHFSCSSLRRGESRCFHRASSDKSQLAATFLNRTFLPVKTGIKWLTVVYRHFFPWPCPIRPVVLLYDPRPPPLNLTRLVLALLVSFVACLYSVWPGLLTRKRLTLKRRIPPAMDFSFSGSRRA